MGTAVHTCILNEDKVRQIRARSASGESDAALAKCFGVHPATIYCIVIRRTWKQVK